MRYRAATSIPKIENARPLFLSARKIVGCSGRNPEPELAR